MNSLLLIGGGGHCRSCLDVIESDACYSVVGVVEVRESSASVLGYPVVGTDDDLPDLLKISQFALITVGQIKSSAIRARLFNRLKELDAKFPVIISPKAYRSKYSTVGCGSIVMHGAIVNAGANIGRNVIINSTALIEHDATIGDHCHISTGACVNGNVSIGEGSFIGSSAVIREGCCIGENVVVGAGQIVLGDVSSNTVVR